MATVAQSESLPSRRSTDPRIAAAIELGWRVAALHALRPSTLAAPPPADELLVNRRGLGAEDRLELELRAIAGVAQRVGVALAGDELEVLLDLVPAAAGSQAGEDRFRLELAGAHVALAKRLWAADEAHGRAYELGNFLSDTWNRVLRPRTAADSHGELLELFAPARVQRMKVLLDDLQTRLDPAAVHVVENHLDAWRSRVAQLPASAAGRAGPAPTRDELAARYEPVERQTIIWRQILTGDKEPEAYIDHDRRGQVRDELLRQLWRRYRHFWWVLPIVAVLGGGIGYLLARESSAAGAIIGTVTAVGGMLGVTRASMAATVRRGLQNWGELMWNRSLAAVICRETLVVDQLVDKLLPARAGDGRSATRGAGGGRWRRPPRGDEEVSSPRTRSRP